MENKRELTNEEREMASNLIEQVKDMNENVQKVKVILAMAELFEDKNFNKEEAVLDITYLEDVINRTKKYIYERFGIDYDKINKE